MTNARVRRGRKTQDHVAEALQYLYPRAEGVSASIPGKDIRNTPGLSIEVKATANVSLPAWLKQARKNAVDGDIPVAIYRPNGAGPESIKDWAAVIPFGEFLMMIDRLGMGEEE